MNVMIINIIYIIFILFIKANGIQLVTKRDADETTSEFDLDQFYPHYVNFEFNDEGEEIKIYKMVFDTISQITWVTNNETNETGIIPVLPKESPNLNGVFENSNYTSKENAFEVQNVLTFNTKKEIKNYDGIIGLPRFYELDEKVEGYEREDLFYYFYPALNLSKNETIISFVHDKNRGKISLGEYDKNFFDLKPSSPSCNCSSAGNDKPLEIINRAEDFWNCNLKSYSIGRGKPDSIGSIALFALGNEFIYAPMSFKTDILGKLDDYFQGESEKCRCEGYSIYCDKGSKLKGLEISFVFDSGLNLTITGNYLFKKYNDDTLQLKIKLTEANYWIFGEPVIRSYNFLFLKNGTYPNGIVFVTKANEYGIALLVIAILCGIIFLIIFIIIFVCYKKEENKRSSTYAANNLTEKELEEEDIFSKEKNPKRKKSYKLKEL